jgi:hypothetical protein
MGLTRNSYKQKKRNAGTRQRKPIIFINAEGKNRTETLYFKAFGHDVNRIIRFAPGDYTDPGNMVAALSTFMTNNDFSPELGDKAYCLIDADTSEAKDSQIEKAITSANSANIQIIVSAPSFEYWFICHRKFTGKQYASNAELMAELEHCIPGYRKNSSNMYEMLKGQTCEAIKNARMIEKKHLAAGKKIHTVRFAPSSEAYYIAEELME